MFAFENDSAQKSLKIVLHLTLNVFLFGSL